MTLPWRNHRDISMNIKQRGMLYALGGIVIGASGGVVVHAQSTATAPAYYVVEVNVRDIDKYKNDYAAHVAATLAPYGGHYLAAGGRTESIEGAPPASRVSLLEFPSVDLAEAWYNSPEYDKIKPVRHAVATTRSFIVEGRVPAPQ
jgi:uncharacterized protein (DUF1330 family)